MALFLSRSHQRQLPGHPWRTDLKNVDWLLHESHPKTEHFYKDWCHLRKTSGQGWSQFIFQEAHQMSRRYGKLSLSPWNCKKHVEVGKCWVMTVAPRTFRHSHDFQLTRRLLYWRQRTNIDVQSDISTQLRHARLNRSKKPQVVLERELFEIDYFLLKTPLFKWLWVERVNNTSEYEPQQT